MVKKDIITSKPQYEEVSIEILPINNGDVITTSKPFNGEDDNLSDW